MFSNVMELNKYKVRLVNISHIIRVQYIHILKLISTFFTIFSENLSNDSVCINEVQEPEY